MTANLWRGRVWSALCTLALLMVLAACDSGGNPVADPVPGTEPSIFGLSKSSVNAGESLSIFGSNFGLVQGAGTVTLNGVPLNVTAWGNHQIDVTVPGGTSSGIIIVTQNGRSSESGQEAQLFVGTVPSVVPVIISISPEAARAGQDSISIVGTGFGASGGSAQVLFTAAGGGTVAGTIVNNSATGTPQWTATNIRVLVPSTARSGPVVVQSASNGPSNPFHLDVLPPQINLDQASITDVTPLGGPVGTELTITGTEFGGFQGNSRAFIQSGTQERELIITEWTNTQIRATLPLGATSGTLHVVVSGKDLTFGTPITVALLPQITAVSPSDLRIGLPVRILGKNFGDVEGTLKIGNTVLSTAQVTSWSNNEIVIDTLPAISLPSADSNDLTVTVTTNTGLASAEFAAKLVSDLRGTVTVNPKTGIANSTEFTFTINAAGNDDSVFKYTLYPDADNLSLSKESLPAGNTSANPQIKHIYTAGKVYKTQVKIEDVTTGDFIILTTPDTPTVTVGGPADVVIVDFAPLDFAFPAPVASDGKPVIRGENANTYLITGPGDPPVYSYNDFIFVPSLDEPFDMWFTTGIGAAFEVNNNGTAWTRNAADFLFGTSKARPYGYRRNGQGGRVRLHGYNFGSSGEIWLNSTAAGSGVQVPPANIIQWNVKTDGSGQPATSSEPGWIDFILPLNQTSIGGKFVVKNDTSGNSGQSADPLVVSAFLPVPTTSPSLAADPNNPSTSIVGFDLTAPAIPGISGQQTRLFFVVQASFEDPFAADPKPTITRPVLCINPFPVTVVNGNQINFDIQAAFPGGVANIEAYNGPATQYQVVTDATLEPGNWQVFVWSGVLPNNGTISGQVLANSGVMSELRPVVVQP